MKWYQNFSRFWFISLLLILTFLILEKRKQERLQESATRRREWNERFGSGRSGSRSNVEQEMSDPTTNADNEGLRNASRKRPTSEYGSTTRHDIFASRAQTSRHNQSSTVHSGKDKKSDSKSKSKAKRTQDEEDVYTVTDGNTFKVLIAWNFWCLVSFFFTFPTVSIYFALWFLSINHLVLKPC